jgi:DNA-binding transcriptional ArsR family regulator
MSNSEPSAIVLHGIPGIGGLYISFDSHGETGSLFALRSSLFDQGSPQFSLSGSSNAALELAPTRFSIFAVLIYSLTRICRLEYIKSVESVFEIIAEPNRRAILSLLVSSEQSVGEIERQLRMTQPAVSKHLRVLRDAGFVESTVDAQRRLYRLKPEPFRQVDAWLTQFRRFWSVHIDALERHLDRMDQDRMHQLTPKKRKTKEKTTRAKPRAG